MLLTNTAVGITKNCHVLGSAKQFSRNASVLAHRDSRRFLPSTTTTSGLPVSMVQQGRNSVEGQSPIPPQLNANEVSTFALSPQARFILRPAGMNGAPQVSSIMTKTTKAAALSTPPPPPKNIAEARKWVDLYLDELHGVVNTASKMLQELAQTKQVADRKFKAQPGTTTATTTTAPAATNTTTTTTSFNLNILQRLYNIQSLLSTTSSSAKISVSPTSLVSTASQPKEYYRPSFEGSTNSSHEQRSHYWSSNTNSANTNTRLVLTACLLLLTGSTCGIAGWQRLTNHNQ